MTAVRAPQRSVSAAHAVVEHLRRCGRGGSTDEEGVAATGLLKDTYAPARFELAKQGVVLDSGRTRPTRSGTQARVWVLASVAPPGLGLTVTRHVAGHAARTRSGEPLQRYVRCGTRLVAAAEFSPGQAVYEIDEALSVERLVGAQEIACRHVRRSGGAR